MKCIPKPDSKLACIALAVAGMLGAMVPAQSGPLTIAIEPLSAPASQILPNIMFILDDSGSMKSDYLPEFLNDTQNLPSSNTDTTFTSAACADTGDETAAAVSAAAPSTPATPAQSLGTITGKPKPCVFGDPPYNSSDFNQIYYNPEFYFQPGVNPPNVVSGVMTDMPSQTSAFTSNWTAVQRNPYVQFANPAGTIVLDNLAANFNDRVWCTDRADSATGGNCRQNTAYQFPDSVFAYGNTTGSTVKYLAGAPYYYRMQTAQYCTTAARDVCVSGSSINVDAASPPTHTFQAPEFCTDSELVDCRAGAAIVADGRPHPFFGPRWCVDAGTLVDCRRKMGTAPGASAGTFKYYIHAKHLGTTKSQTGTFAAISNEGNILVNAVAPAGGTITNITIAGVAVIAGPISIPAGQSTAQVGDLIRAAINGFISVPDYIAQPGGGANVTITQAVSGVSGSGATIIVASNAVGTLSSIGRMTVNSSGSTTAQEIVSLTVNAVNLLCPIGADDSSYGSSVTVKAPNGRIQAAAGTNSATKRTAVLNALTARVTACTGVNGGFTATISGSELRIQAPLAAGAGPNGQAIGRAGTGTLSSFVVDNMGSVQLGTSSGDVSTSLIAMSGGADAFAGTRTVRTGVGAFSRTDIVAGVNSYPKGSKRSDCAGATCTYVEEMTNFANWYAYYRTRMQMMQTSVGRAFIPVDTNYRIGFITICPIAGQCNSGSTVGVNVSPSKYLKIADFTPTQKNAWYTKLYSTAPLGGTPLREALARVGAIYAGRFGSGLTTGLSAANDDPITRSCQPNIALLATDGYWNLGAGLREDGVTAIGNVDNVNAPPYSLQLQGVFDGGTPTASDTLADVALYYYKTDLRTSGAMSPNNVPTTNKDTASHQHMVTFTLALGLDGQLTFRPDYESATSGDFNDIKQGVKPWPVPVADQESAIDDLWHAAVSGRGVYYSVRNPADLAASLSDMRDQLAARIGAGAAAATSSLTPVGGDNFAFTGSFTTSAWTGDLQARTICVPNPPGVPPPDCSIGDVSTARLWSAAALLDAAPYTSRQIYTYDPTDTVAGAGQNGNLLKHFCPPGASGAPCSDGTGLTPSPGGEMDFFAASQLPQAFSTAQQTNATNATLVDYLRGDGSFENTTLSRLLATDLYRSRNSRMGDIVNAQPAYVKTSPFSYSDAGFLGFRACIEGNGSACQQFSQPRRGTVYAAANDGMLHAFETDFSNNNNPYFQTAGISSLPTGDDTFSGPITDNTGNGVERWAYIPGLVLPKLYKLASDPYSHSFFTDGTPQVGDICVSTPCTGQNDWRTILVAGLNSGGIGYYALDITNPLAPKGLWELTHGPCINVDTNGVPTGGTFKSDCHLGLGYGNAVIAKRFHDQRWVVMVTSGYNNTVGGGDGKGYLYILDAVTGNILHRLTTGVGSATVDAAAVPPKRGPSGLAKINGWTTNGVVDNTVLAVYGGDLEGNVWRFKLDFPAGGPPSVTKVAVAKDPAGAVQPITVKPELADVNGERVIVFGTGKFLEVSDKVPPDPIPPSVDPVPFQKQTIYALRDNLSVTGAGPVIPNVRDSTAVPERTFIASGTPGDPSASRTVAVPGNDPTLVANPNLPIDPNLPAAPNLSVHSGWLIDLPDNGERVNVDPILQLGTLVVATNVPTTDTCSAGGYAYLNFLDVTNGGLVPGSTLASTKIASSTVVGISLISVDGGGAGGGGKQLKVITTLADETRQTIDAPSQPAGFVGKRVSWRELFVDQ